MGFAIEMVQMHLGGAQNLMLIFSALNNFTLQFLSVHNSCNTLIFYFIMFERSDCHDCFGHCISGSCLIIEQLVADVWPVSLRQTL